MIIVTEVYDLISVFCFNDLDIQSRLQECEKAESVTCMHCLMKFSRISIEFSVLMIIYDKYRSNESQT